MVRSRPRLTSAILALVSIGLFASLLPQTSFVSRSSGEVVDAVGPVWPEHAVEQALDSTPEIVSEVRIWAAADFARGEAPVVASLRQSQAEEPVRQVKFNIVPSKLLASHILVFPPYETAPSEKLVLQLWVSNERDNHVIFGTSEPAKITPLTINGQPTSYGPLAYEFIGRGSGLRAALAGSTPDLARLAGALAGAALAIAMAVLSHPFVSRTLRNTTRRRRIGFLSLAGRVRAVLRLLQGDRGDQASPAETPAARRAFYLFPWLIPTFAIFHYLANNLLLFRVSESIAIFVVTMAAVTVAFVALRLFFKSAAVAAALTGLLGIAFFSYGHVYVALGDQADDRFLLGIGIPIVLGLGALIIRNSNLARGIGLMLNVGSVALVLLPAYQIATDFYAGSRPQAFNPSERFPGLDQRLAETKDRVSGNQLRDIYYIILDEYPRSGSPPEFDNSDFVQELENRGFYVAPQARSNYIYSMFSIPSSLNMHYVGEDHKRDKKETDRLLELASDHQLGRIAKTLGYRYVHVSSGWGPTETNRNADVVVDFAHSGRILSKPETRELAFFRRATRLWSSFTLSFLQTTAGKPFLPSKFSYQQGRFYHWSHPSRTLAWLGFMKEVGRMEGPKFIFAHIMKPHDPHSFDRYGNISLDYEGWSDDHDPTVSSAFHGQILWFNERMLEVIDALLNEYDKPPIIVIAGDHGEDRQDPSISNNILAAFLLPDGGESAVYPSITSVNHFRAILDYYFELDLGLLEDRVYRFGS